LDRVAARKPDWSPYQFRAIKKSLTSNPFGLFLGISADLDWSDQGNVGGFSFPKL
jgi:hypothetical protein